MKTVEEVAKELWIADISGRNKILRQWAEELINECAERADISEYYGTDESEYAEENWEANYKSPVYHSGKIIAVNKQSITKLKEQL